MGTLALLGCRGLLAPRAPAAAPSWAPRVVQEREVRRVQLALQEYRAFLGLLGHQVERDKQEQGDCLVKMDPRGEQVLQGLWALQELPAHQGQVDLKGHWETKDLLVPLETKERREKEVTCNPRHRSKQSPGRSVSS